MYISVCVYTCVTDPFQIGLDFFGEAKRVYKWGIVVDLEHLIRVGKPQEKTVSSFWEYLCG